MSDNIFELFVDHPLKNESFPLLAMDINNNVINPPRQRFQEIHWHNELQLTYVLKGTLRINTMNDNFTLNENEMIFINKDVLHQIRETSTSHYRSITFPKSLITFSNELIKAQIEHLLESNLEVYIIKEASIIDQLNESIYSNKTDSYREYHISLLLSEIIFHILSNYDFKEDTKEQHLPLQQCLCFIHMHYNEDMTLYDIASYGNISEGHCERLFKNVLDTSPIEYLIDYRIKKSLELLNGKDNTITQIAMEVGFNSTSYFIQCFKKRMGMTPKQYAKQTNS